MGANALAIALSSLVSAGVQVASNESIANRQQKQLKDAEAKNDAIRESILDEEIKSKKAAESIAKGNEARASQAARMKSLAMKAQGRESTILSGSGSAYAGANNNDGRKTLLGE